MAMSGRPSPVDSGSRGTLRFDNGLIVADHARHQAVRFFCVQQYDSNRMRCSE